jgi:protein-tyrosine phosphatase
MRAILGALQRLSNDPQRRVYLHCQGGVGRTGTVVGCLLVEAGYTPDEARDLLARKWQVVAQRARAPESPETAEQRAFIARWRRGN